MREILNFEPKWRARAIFVLCTPNLSFCLKMYGKIFYFLKNFDLTFWPVFGVIFGVEK
jgi:hypothetical protein